jgi:apolipoprotein N-acyltransferase
MSPSTIRNLLALGSGALTPLAYAPVGAWPIAAISLAVLFVLLNPKQNGRPFLTGWLYGLGLFGTGVSWIYVSLHTYGGMPAPLTILATLLFCGFLALFPGWLGGLQAWVKTTNAARLLMLVPALWTLLEWVRGWIFTGFPWLASGYSQVPDSPLAGYAPVLGVYGVSLMLALVAGILAWMWDGRSNRLTASTGLAAILVVLGTGLGLKAAQWTQPQGVPLSVALVQGDIPQELKWDPEAASATLRTYLDLAESARARLIVLPETALPVFYSELPEHYKDELRGIGQARRGDLLAGIPTGSSSGAYLNSVGSFGDAPTQFYDKHHLVPFGEFIPPGFTWVLNLLHIPLSDFSRGDSRQAPLSLAGQEIAVNICYEDAFGEEIIRALPRATLLVNVSNDAWFGDGLAARQHRQISQMRALETGRMMLRATNTGSTAIIDTKGRVVSELRLFQRGVLEGQAQGYAGATPYVRWGNLPAISLAMLLVLAVSVAGFKRQR